MEREKTCDSPIVTSIFQTSNTVWVSNGRIPRREKEFGWRRRRRRGGKGIIPPSFLPSFEGRLTRKTRDEKVPRAQKNPLLHPFPICAHVRSPPDLDSLPLKKKSRNHSYFSTFFPENNDGTPPEAHSASAGLEVREISAREPLIFGLGAELGCHFGWGDGRRR